MTRASLIAFLSLLAWFYGRAFHPLVLLSFSAAVTVFINPSYAWGDIGWLLSFCSFIGVLILAPLLQAYFWGEQSPNAVLRIFIETLSAQMLTLPIIAFVFAEYSPLALLANVLVLPLIPFAMLGTFIAGLSGIVVPSIAVIFAFPAIVLLRYMTWVVDRLSQLPLASAELSFSISAVVGMYCFLFVLMVFLQRRTGYELRKTNVVV
jgi:competence protein ComEC